ncbi:hypothetical protein JCM13304A_05730 [Desulfothermus okinawensis JCM 13304]
MVLIFRLAYIHMVPLQLVPDEAYYWDWSRHLDIGYYSKPPMVAWLNYISTSLFGINEFGVRFFAALFGTASVGILYMLAREMFDENVALLSSLVALLTPANAALSFVMTIDPPLIFFGTLSLLFLWKVTETNGKRQLLYFCILGTSVGLAFLSKQMMLAYLAIMFFLFIFDKKYRPLLKTQGFFLFLIISLSLISLPLYWNYKHNWVTFQETAHHLSSNLSLFKSIKTFLEYIGGQALIMTPIFAIIIYLSIYRGILEYNSLDRRFRFLFVFGPLPLIVFLFLSIKQRVNANWPALFYPPAIIFSIAWSLEKFNKKQFEKWINRGFIVACLFVFLTYITPFVFTIEKISGTKIDPTKRAKGWKELAIQFSDIYNSQKNKKNIFIVGDKRDIISEMAFYMSEHPFIYKIDRTPSYIKDQYEVWDGPGEDMVGRDSLVILKGRQNGSELLSSFHSVKKVAEIKSNIGKNSYRLYSVFKCYNFKGKL